MDITCPNCHEPWDLTHLVRDEIKSTGLSTKDCNAFTGELDDHSKEELEILGWRFTGNHITLFDRCPCCPRETSILRERMLKMQQKSGKQQNA